MRNNDLPEGFQPCKGEALSEDEVEFPVLASAKIDGFRCVVAPDGTALSPSLNPIPNLFLQAYFKEHRQLLAWLDGEITVGAPDAEGVFNRTAKALKTITGEPDFTFWVFDDYSDPGLPFIVRNRNAREAATNIRLSRVTPVRQVLLSNPRELKAYTDLLLARGFEGCIARCTNSHYKFGKFTKKEAQMGKIKPFEDDEARIIELIEGERNDNAAEKGPNGLTKRSSAKAGKVKAGLLGGFRVEIITGRYLGQEAKISTGVLTKAQRKDIWENVRSNPDFMKGEIITFKHMKGTAAYDKPRHATYLRIRPRFDV